MSNIKDLFSLPDHLIPTDHVSVYNPNYVLITTKHLSNFSEIFFSQYIEHKMFFFFFFPVIRFVGNLNNSKCFEQEWKWSAEIDGGVWSLLEASALDYFMIVGWTDFLLRNAIFA